MIEQSGNPGPHYLFTHSTAVLRGIPMLLRERHDRAPAQSQTTGVVRIIVDNDTRNQAMQDGYCVEGKRMAVSHFWLSYRVASPSPASID